MYGYCPMCGARGRYRERRPNGNTTCEKGHRYPSRDSLDAPPQSTLSDRPLTSATFSDVPWVVPGADGSPVRTQLVIQRAAATGGVKIHWWHGPDTGLPHSHPWDFTSEVLYGEITELRISVVDWVATERTLTHRAGETYTMPWKDYHRVISVAPGTVTRMTFGPPVADPNDWGWWDGEKHVTATPDPDFLARRKALNPGVFR